MLKTLPYPDEKEHPDPRQEMIDGPLSVDTWHSPGTATREELGVSDEAPAWWRGDEDASQSFFKAVGIDPHALE